MGRPPAAPVGPDYVGSVERSLAWFANKRPLTGAATPAWLGRDEIECVHVGGELLRGHGGAEEGIDVADIEA